MAAVKAVPVEGAVDWTVAPEARQFAGSKTSQAGRESQAVILGLVVGAPVRAAGIARVVPGPERAAGIAPVVEDFERAVGSAPVVEDFGRAVGFVLVVREPESAVRKTFESGVG